MLDKAKLFFYTITLFIKLLKPGGTKALMAENLALRQQLITLTRNKKRSPKLNTFDRYFFGLLPFFISKHRLKKIAIAIKPATILSFHKILVKRKYQKLFSNKTLNKPGRKGPCQEMIELIIEMAKRQPDPYGGRIATQIFQTFGIKISRFAVLRILKKYGLISPGSGGPSWLSFIGSLKDSLWSVDLFRCESIGLKSHWVMVVIDQFSRRIMGFAVHAGAPNGADYCRMFYAIAKSKPLPKYLSTDNEPLFRFHRWKVNLDMLDIEEIKSIPGVPTSHPFIERTIGSIRREFLDHTLFFNKYDLQKKLNGFKEYFNETRGHSSLGSLTPDQKANNEIAVKESPLSHYRWQSYAGGLYQFPVVN